MDERYHIIARLILKELEGAISIDEKKILNEWIAESDNNLVLYKKYTGKETLMQALKEYDEVMTHKKPPIPVSWFVKIAAAILIVFILSWYLKHPDKTPAPALHSFF